MFCLPRASSTLAFGLSLFFTLSTAAAVDIPGDFNGDGRVDAILQPLTPMQPGAIVLRDGTGRLTVMAQQWPAGYLGLDWSTADSALTAADLNGDGQDDVILQPRKAGETGAVMITDPSIQVTHISQLLAVGHLGLDWSAANNVITAGDFDGDRQKELLLQSTQVGGAAVLVHADASGRLVAVMQRLTKGFLGRYWDTVDETLYVGDFNGDGRQDLLVQSHRAGKGESVYALLLADGDGRFSRLAETWNDKDLGANWNPANHKIVIADTNGDGISDIELMSTTGGPNYVFETDTQGRFTAPSAHWTGDQPVPSFRRPGTKSGSGVSVIPSAPRTDSINAPTNPEQDPTIPRTGGGTGGAQGSGLIMTVNAAGRVEGSPGVSGGTATYSIPVVVPPGIAGMQPSVSLNYSSRGGNGEMGMGWSLSAGSQIHRCPATQAMDGSSTGVTYTSSDRLCLDGQHLILVSGSYGSAGAVYRTELDGFSQITQSQGTGIADPSSQFIVTTKGGHQMRYGYSTIANTNAVFIASGQSQPLAWALFMDVDTYGNTVNYYYSTYGAGEHLLTQILYTGYYNGSSYQAGNREIDFAYSPRSDVSTQYLAGGLTSQTLLLATITTHENNALVRSYSVDYSISAATGRSLVNGVQECAGTGTSEACLPETTFSWHQPQLTFKAPSTIDTNDTCADSVQYGSVTISTPGDVNGDGFKDVMVATSCDVSVYLMGPNGVPSAQPISVGSKFAAHYVQEMVDIDGDGTADLIGPMQNTNVIGYSRYDTSTGNFTTVTALQANGQTIPISEVVAVEDVDGDGLPDLVVNIPDPVHTGNHMLAVYWNTTQACSGLGCHPAPQFSVTPQMIFTAADQPALQSPVMSATSVGDMDGNGLPDFSVSYLDASNVNHAYWVFTRTTGGTATFPTVDERNDGRTAAAWAATMMDINGDDLPDAVYECGGNGGHDLCYALNTGSDSAGAMFAAEKDSGILDWRYSPNGQVLGASLTADIDNDGAQEILYPEALLADFCVKAQGANGVDECSNGDGGAPLPADSDYSIYQYSEIKFSWGQFADGTYGYVPEKLGTAIQAQSHLAAPIDLQGDGLTGIVSPFTHMYILGYFVPKNNYSRPVGLHVASNSAGSLDSHNAAPDLMLTATDGFQHTAKWDYYPLTSGVTSNGMSLYASPGAGGNGYAGHDYFYFSSSMYVVGDYVEDNGVGGSNIHDFHYGQAIYNNQGRGFQGFRVVVDDDMVSAARTVQYYHQRFPLSGMLEESWTTNQSNAVDLTSATPSRDANAVDDVQNTWGCMQGSQPQMSVDSVACHAGKLTAKTYVPVLQQSVETHFDVNSHDQLSQTTTYYCKPSVFSCGSTGDDSGYDAYGNSLGSNTVTTDADGAYSSSVLNTYDTTDTADWWVDKLTDKVTNVQAAYGAPYGGTQPLRARTTHYDYYSVANGRGLNHTYAYADGTAGAQNAHEIDTQYAYTRGNVTSVTVSGGYGATAVAARTTTTTYSSGADANYFVASVTDPVGLVTNYQYDPRFGEATQVVAPDQVTTNNTYDSFGRLISTQVGSLPVQTTQYITHTASDGMCDGTSDASTYYVLVNQNGQPSHYTCYDTLNRAVRAAAESFTSTSELVNQDTTYDSRGRVISVTEPHFVSKPAASSTRHYDDSNILGRMDYQIDAKGVKTSYTYTDLVTDIETTTPGDTLNSSYDRKDEETKNSLGKLMKVTNALGAAEEASTAYQYDSDGNPVTITAADGTQINAVYDILGHKTDVTDPDQGHTGYTYDVLGELLTQTDAKSQQLQMTYDLDGRMVTKLSPEGTTTWCYGGAVYQAGTHTCDTTSVVTAKGKVSSLGQSWQSYQENYTYDSYGRVQRDEEVIDGTAYDTDTAYNSLGQVDTVTYPSSIANATPVANAGTTLYAAPSSAVTLNGSATDSDGPQALAYQWAQTAGPTVALSGKTTLSPGFTTGAALGTTYTFQLTADDGLSGGSASVNVVVPNVPAAPGTPTDDGDTNHDGTYLVSWSGVSVPGATVTYSLEEAAGTSTGPTASWSPVSGCSPSAVSCTVSHANNSSYYYWYRVRAQDAVNGTVLGWGPYSAGLDSIHVVVTPGAPASISPTVASTTTGSYNIVWDPYTGSVKAADVYYQLQMATNTTWTGASIVYTGTSRTASFSNPLGDYYYRVEACNKDGTVAVCSAWTGRAHEIVTGTGGGGQQQPQSQIQAPVQAPSSGSYGAAVPAVKPISIEDAAVQQKIAVVRSGKPHAEQHRNPVASRLAMTETPTRTHARPKFAPPVYKAWAHARLMKATGTTPILRFAVKYIYSNNGYLSQLASAVDPNRVYWQVDTSKTGGDGTANPLSGNYYESGMDARGNVTDSIYGTSGHIVNTHDGYDPNTGYMVGIQSTNGSTTYQSQTYRWYAIGNLYSRASASTTDNPNALSETFGYDLHNRLKTSTVTNGAGSQPAVSYQYDSVGDILQKSDATGTTTYGYAGVSAPQPHAVTTLTQNAAMTASYSYDADGNMACRDAAGSSCVGNASPNTTWNSDNLPTQIIQGAANSSFSYAPDKHRYKQVGTDGTTSTTTLYVGGMEIATSGGTTHYHLTISAYGRPVMLDDLSSNSSGNPSEAKSYLLTDHLGSVMTTVADTDGSAGEQDFDSFGRHRDPATWQVSTGSTTTLTKHGFTGHEHLDNLGLVHMNGRIYDPTVGRMMSVDPVYQAPTNSQSGNPYSYVMNNPLSLVDPTGYEAATPDGMTIGEKTGGPDATSSMTGSCSSGESASSCAGSLQNGQSANIVDSNGNVIGTVGKDSSGNLLVTGGNGSNFGQTPQFTSTISGNTLTTSNGAIEAQMTMTPDANAAAGGSGEQMAPAHTNLTIVGTPQFVDDVNQVKAKAEAGGIAWKPGDKSIFDELAGGPVNILIEHGSVDSVAGDEKLANTLDVLWNEKEGTSVMTRSVGQTDRSSYQSAALGLIHELGHAYQVSIKGIRQGALDENEVINGIERQWAEKYFEPIRSPMFAHGGDDRDVSDIFEHTNTPHP